LTEVIKGGMAAQQNVRVGDLLVGCGGKSFDGMSEQEVTREIKESKSTGKLKLIRLKKDGGEDLPGAPAAAGDGKHKQRQEARRGRTHADGGRQEALTGRRRGQAAGSEGCTRRRG